MIPFDMSRLMPDIDHAQSFLNVLSRGNEDNTFQVFGENNKKGARIIHGSLDQCSSDLIMLNRKGFGVFVMINEGDGEGRKNTNVIKVRAVFADFDNRGGQEKIASVSLRPHIIVESSPGKYHAYWLVRDMPLEQFSPTQKAIASLLGSDPTVCDLPRVMRLPGFYHLKGEPFMTHMVE